MRIEPYSRYGAIGFVVYADNEADRALLGLVTSLGFIQDKEFRFHGFTHSCGAVTSFNFGWSAKP